jgi:hypothetical protein
VGVQIPPFAPIKSTVYGPSPVTLSTHRSVCRPLFAPLFARFGFFQFGHLGSLGFDDRVDARTWASWGFDLLKHDWCSYERIAKDRSLAELQKPYLVMRDALRKVDRDIVYNLCQYGERLGVG